MQHQCCHLIHLSIMPPCTCNSTSPPNPSSDTEKPSRAIWLPEDTTALVAFLHKRQSEAGDGMNFKASMWTAAAAELEKTRVRGGVKGPAACKSKYLKVSPYLCMSMHH